MPSNARGPENEVDEWEKAFIEDLSRDPSLDERSAVREIGGKPYLTVLRRGQTMEVPCLRCHTSPELAPDGIIERYGRERSFNRRPGEAVSAISVRIPVSEAYETADSVSTKLSGILFAIFLVLLASWLYLNQRFLITPLSSVRRKALEISSNPELLGEEIPLLHGSELAGLTAAFNRMSVALRREKAAMEERARQATADIRDAHALLRGVINSSQDIIFIKGTDLRYIACNTAFLKVVGLARMRSLAMRTPSGSPTAIWSSIFGNATGLSWKKQRHVAWKPGSHTPTGERSLMKPSNHPT